MDESKTEMAEGDSRPAHARVLRWGNTEAVKELMEVLETGHFDLVLGSDLVYPEQVQNTSGRKKGHILGSFGFCQGLLDFSFEGTFFPVRKFWHSFWLRCVFVLFFVFFSAWIIFFVIVLLVSPNRCVFSYSLVFFFSKLRFWVFALSACS